MLAQTFIPPVTFLEKELPVVDSVKDPLGVIIDKHLSFNEHIGVLAADLIGKLPMIIRIRHLFDQSTLFTVINSLIFTKLFYCSSVWSGTSKCNIAKLQLFQNFAARLLSRKRKYEHITPALKKLKLLPVSDLFNIRDGMQIFKCMNNLAPGYLVNMFQKRSQIHYYNTRNNDNLNISKCRTALA
jgi:hypothetical protein